MTTRKKPHFLIDDQLENKMSSHYTLSTPGGDNRGRNEPFTGGIQQELFDLGPTSGGLQSSKAKPRNFFSNPISPSS